MKGQCSAKRQAPAETHLSWWRSLLILAIYTLLTLLLTYPLIFNLTTTVPNDIGDPLLNTWILAWDSHALLTDPLNLFNANIFHPLPNTLAYSEHLISTALLALPLQLFFGEPILAYNLSLLITFPLAGFGMYLLILHWTGHRGAAFLAGLIFAFNPYRFAALAHLQLLTFQWLPYALLFLDLWLRRSGTGDRGQGTGDRRRFLRLDPRLVGLVVFLLLQLLSSWYLALYTALILGIYLLAVLLARRLHLARLARLMVTLLLVTLFSLPFIIPYLPLIDELRAARPLSLALSLAATPTDYLAAAPFNRVFGPLTEPFRARSGFTEENVLFSGVVALVLVLLALVISIRSDLLRITNSASGFRQSSHPMPAEAKNTSAPRFNIYALLIILIVATLLTFPSPYAALANIFPPSTVIRVPPRWIIPALFALAGLAAFGFRAITPRLSRFTHHAPRTTSHAPRLLHYGLLLLISALLLIESLSIPLPLAPVENRDMLNPAYTSLAAQPDNVALVELPLHSAPAPEYPEVKRLYASTVGWWRLVNGYSGYTPPRQPLLAQTLAHFPDPASIKTLQTLATPPDSSLLTPSASLLTPHSSFLTPHSSLVTRHSSLLTPHASLYLLVHPGEAPLDRTRWETSDRWQAERTPALYPVGQFEGDYLYQVLPEDPRRFAAPLATFGHDQATRLLAVEIERPSTATPDTATDTPAPRITRQGPRLFLYWRPTASLPTDYTVFVHLRAPDGFVRSQADGPPVSGHYPTSQWQPGEIIQDLHSLPPEDFSQVDHLAIGLYDPATGERLPAFGSNGEPLEEDIVIIATAE